MPLIFALIGIGIVAAVWLNRLLTSFLTEVGRLDPAVLGSAALIILSAAVTACVLPGTYDAGVVTSAEP